MSLKDAVKKSTTTTTSIKEERNNRIPPEGAKIIEQTVRTETEEIENGWLVIKSWDGRYKEKGDDDEDKYGNWFNYSKKWFSKEDPLTITVNDKSLADAFEEE